MVNATVALTSSLSALTDCTITTPSNNQILQYNTASSKWINQTVSLSTALSSLTDCTITTPASGNLLIYNGSTWINADTIPDSLLFVKDDVDGTTKITIPIIKYYNRKYKNINNSRCFMCYCW